MPEEWGDCLEEITTPQGPVEIPTIKCIEVVFKNILLVVTSLAGLALFVMFLVGGFKYLTSGGDPKASESAKNTMTYALIGLVVIIASYLILKFIATFTGIPDLLNFKIPTF